MLDDVLQRVEKRLEAVGLSAQAASVKAGLSKDAIRNMQRAVQQKGRAGVSTRTITALAPVLETSVSWLLEGEGDESSPSSGGIVSVMGYVGAGAEIEPDFEQTPPDGLEEIQVPFPLPAEMIAFQIRGDSMLPVYKDGHIVIVYREQKRPLEAFYGEEAAVRTADGRRFIKTVMRGVDGVNLFSWNAAVIENVHLEWIGEIFAVLPRSSIRHIDRKGGIQGRLRIA
ncbi:XRE family transcriptional regulator [Brucella intermedia]|uniref:XRE family transcriptional regulator n=1 Tax=Brucella intermedia TaxID=94625 RepID=UPI00244C993E|nr:LexA family transcriptional regulator [Brucella intermedia]WGG61838.1 LexA family transcriptional regulator [Brucella intermedia]